MTMISGYKLKEGGFLQADILLTSSNKRIRPSQIPSFKPDAGSLHYVLTPWLVCAKKFSW